MKRLRLWLLLLPFALFYLGCASNILAVTVNDGTMPVVVPRAFIAENPSGSMMDDVHVAYSADVHLAALCDWIQIPHMGVVSPGDCLLWLGEYLTVPLVSAWFGLLIFAPVKERV